MHDDGGGEGERLTEVSRRQSTARRFLADYVYSHRVGDGLYYDIDATLDRDGDGARDIDAVVHELPVLPLAALLLLLPTLSSLSAESS
jgi:hypothetical protein